MTARPKRICPWRGALLAACFIPLAAAHAVDGFWLMAGDLALTNQANWRFYDGGDAPEGGYMGWLWAGATNLSGTVSLGRTLPAGTYYVMVKVGDYMGNPGQLQVRLGGGQAELTADNNDWNKHWTLPGIIQAPQPADRLDITLVKTIVATNVQKYLIRGVYITTNANENVPLYGYDRIVNWEYPTASNAPSPSRGNLFQNSSFEVGVSHGWGFKAASYARSYSIGALWDTNSAYHGRASVRFRADSDCLISRVYRLRPNRSYTVSAWVRSLTPSSAGLVIRNVGVPPPGAPPVRSINQGFRTSTDWQRISVSGFMPAYPTAEYQVTIVGKSNVWVDAVQLEEGALSDFVPRSSVDVGFASAEPGHVLFDDGPPALDLAVCTPAAAAFSGSISFEVFDIFNRKVLTGAVPVTVPAGARSVIPFAVPPDKRGIFRVSAWIDGVDGTLEEFVYAVVPRPSVASTDESSIVGVHPNFLDFQMAMHQRLGFKWGRAMSPESIFRWSAIEPVEGQIVWRDEKVDRAVASGMVILGTIGSNRYWPDWAETNGLPDLDKWEIFVERLVTHYRGRVRYWEIWNEPIYAFTPEFYAELLRRAAAAIRRADPTAKIVGMGGVYDRDWVVQVMELLGSDWRRYMDYASTHLYPPNTDPSGGETEARAVEFKNRVIDHYGVELWNTESGVLDEGFYKGPNSNFQAGGEPIWPYADSERYVRGCFYEAERLLENFAHCVGNGLTKFFYYDSRIYVDPSYSKSHPTMLEYDDSIRSKGIAYAIAGSFLGHARGLGSVSPSPQTTYAYLFDCLGKPTVVLWAKDKANHSISVGVADWQVFDLMGNAITVTNGGFAYGRTPVYVLSHSLALDGMRSALLSATVSDAADTLPPSLSIDEFPPGPVAGEDVRLRWLGIDETSIPSAAQPDAVTYSYRLDGRDSDWSPWTAAVQVTYASLQPGRYTFAVRARDAAGNYSLPESRQIVVTVAPADPAVISPGPPRNPRFIGR